MSRQRLGVTKTSLFRSTRGFTLTEALIAVVILGMVASIVGTRISPLLTRSGAEHAASVVALDLEKAVSLAARQRKPVRIACDCGNQAYFVTDRASGTLLLRRPLAGNGGYGVTGLEFSTPTVDVFPSGLASSALTVTIRAGTVARYVTMSTGAFVRVVR